MTPKQVIAQYGWGSQTETANFLGLSRQVVNNWVKRGRVPLKWQVFLAKHSRGKLKLEQASRPNA